jgi:large subunit ribosomal protein L31
MQSTIHPKYHEAEVICACGNKFVTRSTLNKIKIEICNKCHPFYTGQQKLIDSAGRVERFGKRFAATGGKTISRKKKVQKKIASPLVKIKGKKVLSSTPTAEKKKKKDKGH